MSGSSLLLVLLVVGAVLGALLLLPSSTLPPTVVPSGATADLAPALTPVVHMPPSVDAGADRTIGERETIRLAGSGRDAAGGPLAYRWTGVGGLGFLADPSQPDTAYTAPSACDCWQSVTLTLTATNRYGMSASDSVTLSIRDPIGCPQERSACGDIAVTRTLPCGPAPSSPCPAKPDLPCAGSCVTQAPVQAACDLVPVPCSCSGGCGAVRGDTWPQAPSPLAARDRPTPRIARQYPAHVAEGSATPLHAVVANPACSSVCFAWSASQGWLDRADTLDPVYHAPSTQRPEGGRVTITFTIVDASGTRSSDQIRLDVDETASP